MIIDCISDLHGFFPKLEGGDLLIVAGDLTTSDTLGQHGDFKKWLYEQDYRKKIVIAGNHDNHFVGLPSNPYIFSSYNSKTGEQLSYAEYLCDSGTEFEGLKVWGSPWTKTFEGMNPACKAFTLDTEELSEKWALIPNDTDILITHSPPYGILDQVYYMDYDKDQAEHAGSTSLLKRCYGSNGIFPRLHIFGHIHENGGKMTEIGGQLWPSPHPCVLINASHVNERYKPVNKPIRVIL